MAQRTSTLVDGLSNDVHDSTEAGRSDGDKDGRSSVNNLGSSDLDTRRDNARPSLVVGVGGGGKAANARALGPKEGEDGGRTRPSVPSMAMHRRVFSPRCCETSSTSRPPEKSMTSSALRIAGRFCLMSKQQKARKGERGQKKRCRRVELDLLLPSLSLECIRQSMVDEMCTHVRVELDVDDGSDDGLDVSGRELGLGSVRTG